MRDQEAELRAAQGMVEAAEERLNRQAAIITEMNVHGLDTGEAAGVYQTLQRSLAIMLHEEARWTQAALTYARSVAESVPK